MKYDLNTAAGIANFHAFAAGYANDNARYTNTGTATELLEKLLDDACQTEGASPAEALEVSADQVEDAKKAFLFAATGHERTAPTHAVFQRGEFQYFSHATAQDKMDCGTPDFEWVALSAGQQAKLVLDGDGCYNATARLEGHKCRVFLH